MLLLGLVSGISIVAAAPTGKQQNTVKLVDFDLRKAPKTGRGLLKVPDFGGEFVNAKLQNFQYYYQIQLAIGTPPQTIDFTIDTGSSDLWVMAGSNPYCTTDSTNTTGINCTGSVFDTGKSSTFHSLPDPFSIGYGDRTFANGSFATDVVRVGQTAALINSTFGVAAVGNSSTCVFGIGFIGDEGQAHVHRNGSGVYPTYFNVPTLMKQQGLIDTNAYALWLNDAQATSGSILFGGVDQSKYDGPLTLMPIFNNYHEYIDHPIQMRVMLNSIGVNGQPLADFDIAVLLDSGTSFSYLPPELVDAFGQSLGFIYEDSVGYYLGSTSSALTNVEEFELDFSGAIIKVPTSDLLVGITMDDGTTPFVVNGEPQSILAMGAADDSYSYILGDVFLRSMYAVFDLDHYEIALAQSRKNSTAAPDLLPVEAIIPGATQAARYASTSTNNSLFNVYTFAPVIPPPTAITVDLSISTTRTTSNGTLSTSKASGTASVVTSTSTSSEATSAGYSSRIAASIEASSDIVTELAPSTTSASPSTITMYWDSAQQQTGSGRKPRGGRKGPKHGDTRRGGCAWKFWLSSC